VLKQALKQHNARMSRAIPLMSDKFFTFTVSGFSLSRCFGPTPRLAGVSSLHLQRGTTYEAA
jgi:hypothetical protein